MIRFILNATMNKNLFSWLQCWNQNFNAKTNKQKNQKVNVLNRSPLDSQKVAFILFFFWWKTVQTRNINNNDKNIRMIVIAWKINIMRPFSFDINTNSKYDNCCVLSCAVFVVYGRAFCFNWYNSKWKSEYFNFINQFYRPNKMIGMKE